MEDLVIKKLIVLGKLLNNPDIIKMSRRLMMEREKGLGQYSIKKLIEMDKVIDEVSSEFNFYKKDLLDWAENNIDEEKLKELNITLNDFIQNCISIYKEEKQEVFSERYGVNLDSSIPEFLPSFLENHLFPFAKNIFIKSIEATGNSDLYKEYLSKDMYSILGYTNMYYIIDNGEEFFLNFFKNTFHEFEHNIVNPMANHIFLKGGATDTGNNFNLLDILDETFTLAAGPYLGDQNFEYENIEKNLLKLLAENIITHLAEIFKKESNETWIESMINNLDHIIREIDSIEDVYIDSEKKKVFLKQVLSNFKDKVIEFKPINFYQLVNILNLEITKEWNKNKIDFVTSSSEDLLIEFSKNLDENIDKLSSIFYKELRVNLSNSLRKIINIIKAEAENEEVLLD